MGEVIAYLASTGGAAGLLGMAWNLRNAWKVSQEEAVSKERRHQETLAEIRQAHAVQSAILDALVERMDRADVRADRIEMRIESILNRKE